jgi:hypothetical protein
MSVLATATPPSILAGGSSQLNTIVTGGSGTNTFVWTSIPAGFNSTQQNPMVNPLATTQYIVNANDGTQTKGDTVTVTVTQGTLIATATASPSSICIGNSSQLNVTAAGGTTTYSYSWTSIPAGFTSNLQNPMVQPVVTTIYIAQVNDGTSIATDSVTVIVTPLPTVAAGNDTTVCVTTGQLQLNGQTTNSSTVLWATSGDGTFMNASTLNAIYLPGANDKANLHVNLTLTASPMPPCTPNASSVKHVVFDPCDGIPQEGNDVFSVSIRPNPSFGFINVVITGVKTGEVSISIMDLSGKIVFSDNFEATGSRLNSKLNLSDFRKGIYFVKIKTETDVKTEKLIME